MEDADKPGLRSISPGARELLRIALENDEHRAICNNASLFAVVEAVGSLVGAASRGQQGLEEFIGRAVTPPCFLVFVAGVLQRVRASTEKWFDSGTNPWIVFNTDFDRHALQAFAEGLADIAWPDRRADDFDGPPLVRCAERIASAPVESLLEVVAANYVANILQHYFSAAEVRRLTPGLDETAEMELRVRDASALARVFRARIAADMRTRRVLAVLQEAMSAALEEHQ